jgi:hypothetical protein
MADLSGFWTTNDGTGADGDQQASYTQAHWSSAIKILAGSSGHEGVLWGYLNELECADDGTSVSIDTGGAVVDGKWYYNNASQNVAITAASAGNTRVDRIVLRADWSGFAISPTRIAGTDGTAPTAPGVTQTSGTTYDIKLCQALVNDAGGITVTDEREWATWDKDHTVYWRPIAYSAALSSGDGLDYWYVPTEFDGMVLTDFDIAIHTVSSSGAVSVQLYNATDSTDMLSTNATIDEGERTSYTAATPPAIDTNADDVAEGDRLRLDVDGNGTDVTGLDVIMVFRKA